jgi:hypothetical protein
VVNGDKVANTGICKDVKFSIAGEEFVLDLFVIPLAGYEMVLGIHWLRTLSPILWDFAHACMSYWHNSHRVVWQGMPARGASASAFTVAMTDLMATLLRDFDDVFATPTGLPPPRRHMHQIHLQPGTASMVVCPYRYPQLVKDELEQQCRDMMQQGIIRPSTLAFSSPALLVKKQDNSWHFYVNYRALNAKTVRTCFPSQWWTNS